MQCCSLAHKQFIVKVKCANNNWNVEFYDPEIFNVFPFVPVQLLWLKEVDKWYFDIDDQSGLNYLSGKRVWGFSRFTSDCTSGNRKSASGTGLDQRDDISDSCSEMLLQIHDVFDPEKVWNWFLCFKWPSFFYSLFVQVFYTFWFLFTGKNQDKSCCWFIIWSGGYWSQEGSIKLGYFGQVIKSSKPCSLTYNWQCLAI